MPAIRLDVLTLVPTLFRQCAHCETVIGQSGLGERVRQESLNDYPAQMLEEYERLSAWIKELADRYGDQILIRVIDPQSGFGLWKSLRHKARSYPTFIINNKQVYAGWDRRSLDELLQGALPTRSEAMHPIAGDE